jgi:endoglucanase
MCRFNFGGYRYSWLAGLLVLILAVHTAATANRNTSGITISGNSFRMNGKPWTPKGFTLVGLVAPEGHAKGRAYRDARMLQGETLLRQARELGANTLRFQVSQPGLNPESEIYDPDYLNEVVSAIRQARKAGFAIIISMQWEKPAGLAGQPMMPSANTERAWAQLAPIFSDDKHIMLELFNEPGMWEKNPKAWPAWRNGMQTLVDNVRKKGCKNILILDGIQGAHVLSGAPAINDPLRQLAYAVHPYIKHSRDGPPQWDRQWGRFAENHPVLITEWNAKSNQPKCTARIPEVSCELIRYISERKIGLVLWALDLPRTLLDDKKMPMTFSGFTCGVRGAGAAHIAIQYFLSGTYSRGNAAASLGDRAGARHAAPDRQHRTEANRRDGGANNGGDHRDR